MLFTSRGRLLYCVALVFIFAKDGSPLRKNHFLADAWPEDLKKKMPEADISTFRAP
jgi:hypothetical protein